MTAAVDVEAKVAKALAINVNECMLANSRNSGMSQMNGGAPGPEKRV